jgi:hypothetical protein
LPGRAFMAQRGLPRWLGSGIVILCCVSWGESAGAGWFALGFSATEAASETNAKPQRIQLNSTQLNAMSSATMRPTAAPRLLGWWVKWAVIDEPG